jgi:hypothetical protein
MPVANFLFRVFASSLPFVPPFFDANPTCTLQEMTCVTVFGFSAEELGAVLNEFERYFLSPVSFVCARWFSLIYVLPGL